jgi:hypothetical protein
VRHFALPSRFVGHYDAWSGKPGGAGPESRFTSPAWVLEMANNERDHEQLAV